MNVSSYLELYLDIFGWTMFDRIWDILVSSGFALFPFVGMLLKNIIQPMYKQAMDEASTSALRAIELDILKMFTVITLAAQPFITMDVTGLSYTKACSATATTTAATPGNTGTTYDSIFITATIGGNTAKVPVWWYAVLALSSGFNDAVISSIPCSADIRLMTYKMQNARVKEPLLRRQVQLFYNDCYAYAMSRYMDTATTPSAYPAEDLYWLGSKEFTTNFYGKKRASENIPGFNYSAARDLEYDPAIEIPTYGKPTCNEWWSGANATDPKYGLRNALLNQIDTPFLTELKNSVTTMVAGKTQADVEDTAIKTLINAEKTYFNGLQNLQNYNDRNLDVLNSAAGSVGSILESFSFYPKMYMVKMAAPILQASVLMIIFTLLPFVILFSSYDIGTMMFMSVVIFSVKFWTVLWAIAHWLDNHLMVALKPNWYQMEVANNLVPEMMINFVTGGLFIVLPIFWSGLLGWAGFAVGNEINNLIKDSNSQAQSAGGKGADVIKGFIGKGISKK